MEKFQKVTFEGRGHDPLKEQIIGFSGEKVDTKGYIDLPTTFGRGNATKTITIKYLVVDTRTSYNALVGRSSLNKLGAIVSTPHLAMKFPTKRGDIATIYRSKSSQRVLCGRIADGPRAESGGRKYGSQKHGGNGGFGS